MTRPTITCVAPIFPTPWIPESGAFLKNIADVMADEGFDVQVVAPLSVARQLRERSRKGARKATLTPGYSVVRPRFVELPLRLVGANDLTRRINEELFRAAVERGLAACRRPVTLVYGHFWIGGYAARRWCRARGVPYFVELQESGIRGFLDPAGAPRELRVFLDSAGVVSVSRDNERFLVETGVASTTSVRYLPNGFDQRRFVPLDRASCRRSLGLSADVRLVVFAGHFIERKGPLRVLQALEHLNGVQGIFLGRGPQWPSGRHVAHAGPVPNGELPMWLSAADVFVLPSLAEGLPNVTVEAMACGLPLVVSDRPFNRDFLSENDAVFVDPESAPSIAEGLALVLGSECRRTALAASALARSGAFSLQDRVRRIRDFMVEQVGSPDGHRPPVPLGHDQCA
jgi:glycosyltransferase involved in cell wall biosynthesis